MSNNRNWAQKLQDAATRNALTLDGRVPNEVVTRGAGAEIAQLVAELRSAAERFAVRRDSFAEGKAATCLDIAAKVERFGSFASPRQQDFALKLIEWSKPRAAAKELGAPKALPLPKLFGVMQKHSHFHAEPLKLSRKNQDSLVWVIWHGEVVGKIESGYPVLFKARLLPDSVKTVEALLREFETDPLAAAMKYGKLSGRCCSCGRDLTDPESIERGIGPVCAERF